jgi:hypothetical protein
MVLERGCVGDQPQHASQSESSPNNARAAAGPAGTAALQKQILKTRPHDFVASPTVGLYVVSTVKMKNLNSSDLEPDGVRERLTRLREALLHLHKTLLESERVSYEASFGKIASPYQFLHLLTNDPWFGWLTPVTQLLAAMDEMLDAKEPLTVAGVEDLAQRMKTLLVPTEGGEGFSRHYDEALQRNPDVLFAHAAMAKLIRAQTAGK